MAHNTWKLHRLDLILCIVVGVVILRISQAKIVEENAKRRQELPIAYGKVRQNFFNDGMFDNWDSFHHEHKGTISMAHENCFENGIDEDAHCLKFTQVLTVLDYISVLAI